MSKTYIGRNAVVVFNGEKIQSFEGPIALDGHQTVQCSKCGIFLLYFTQTRLNLIPKSPVPTA
jgi:hypothetical protein